MVTGNDAAKWLAARALRNLANHAAAKELILKADGIAILTPLAKHDNGKGKVKEAAGEALNLLFQLRSQLGKEPEWRCSLPGLMEDPWNRHLVVCVIFLFKPFFSLICFVQFSFGK